MSKGTCPSDHLKLLWLLLSLALELQSCYICLNNNMLNATRVFVSFTSKSFYFLAYMSLLFLLLLSDSHFDL